jgi:hypothetical protein
MVHPYFQIERIAIIAMGSFFALYFLLLHCVAFKRNSGHVRPLHKTFQALGTCLSLLLVAWGVDDRGVSGIYPVEFLVVIEDLFGTIAFFCLTRWLFGILATVYRNLEGKMRTYVTLVPNIISFALFVVCDALAIAYNLSWWRRFLLFYWAIFCAISAAGMIRSLFNIHKIFSATHTTQGGLDQASVIRKLQLGIIGVLIVAAFDVYASLQIFRASKKAKTLVYDVSVDNVDQYSFFPSPGIFFVIIVLVAYAGYIPFKRKQMEEAQMRPSTQSRGMQSF